MTPDGIRFRLIQVQADELYRIIAAMKANPPPNAAELVGVIRELRAELAAAVAALPAATGGTVTHVATVDDDDDDDEGVTASPLPRPE